MVGRISTSESWMVWGRISESLEAEWRVEIQAWECGACSGIAV